MLFRSLAIFGQEDTVVRKKGATEWRTVQGSAAPEADLLMLTNDRSSRSVDVDGGSMSANFPE